ncbi:HotDog domain containing protein [Rhypophila sp. PSN 637]
MANKSLKGRTRHDYPYILEYRTRWSDNDMYNHMNNTIYNQLFDSVINAYLIDHGLDPATSPQHPLMARTSVDYFGSISYPAVAELSLRVNHLGRSSATYEVGLFEKNVKGIRAVGEFVHVFVDRETGRPNANGMNSILRQSLEKILVKPLKGKL